MAKQVAAWAADDGTIFATEDEAKNHDFEVALAGWWTSIMTEMTDPPSISHLQGLMRRDRQKLLTIFKLLNGSRPFPTHGVQS